MYDSIFNLRNPDIVLECRDYKTSVKLYEEIRSFGSPKIYCYAICYRSGFDIEFIKIGESAPNPIDSEGTVGERIKRQLEHVPGWDDKPYHSSHGDDLWKNMSREINLGNLPILTKDHLMIGIWNIEAILYKIDFYYKNNKELSRYVEGVLVEQYKNLHEGKLPILNIADPTRNKDFHVPKMKKELFEVS